ncbi:MAG: hypothetical protein JKY84_05030, partial [Emcibacteraceae bacterium]|nr:hypothetical protein [Emcibacteraceae bacterium]
MFYIRNLPRQSSLIKSFAIKCIFYTIMCFQSVTANAQEAKTILAYGDSLFSKDNLDDGDSFPEQLESKLKELGFIGNVIGAGNGGFTSGQALERIDIVLDSNPEIDLVILEFGGNDMFQNISPDTTYANLEKMINIFNDRKIPIFMAGLIMPFNGYQGYSNRYNYVYTELSEKYNLPLDPFFLEGISGISELNQPDGIHPNKFGNSLIAARLSPAILQTLIDIERYDEIQSLLTKLNAEPKVTDDLVNSLNVEKTDNKKNILIFGDSLVAGYGLDPQFAFPAQLEVKLKEMNPNIIVYNAGVSGDTSSAGMARLEWVLSSYDDLDLV